jgi:hypothetical protein
MIDVEGRRALSDLQFVGLVLRTIGPDGLARLVAFCTVWYVMGYRTHQRVDEWAAEFRRYGGPGRATVYRSLADLRKVHIKWAEAEGRPVKPAPTLDDVAEMAGRFAEMGRASTA